MAKCCWLIAVLSGVYLTNIFHQHKNETFQGLTIKPIEVNTTASGVRSENGTWNGNLGYIQSGTFDIWAKDVSQTMQRNSDFLFTMPFTIERYGALMKRQTIISADVKGITAGIDISIYGMLFALLLFLY